MNSDSLQAPTLAEELSALENQIRAQPDNADLRAQLFQLLVLLGDWSRAETQLKVCYSLNPKADSLMREYAAALKAEAARTAVFAGLANPGLPDDAPLWLSQLADALQQEVRGQYAHASALREQAWAAAPVQGGTLTTHADSTPQRFDWVADGDNRFGPVLELLVGEDYVWLPFSHVSSLRIAAPAARCDLAWARAALSLHDGSERAVLIPARYPIPANKPADACLQARLTEWQPLADSGHYFGLGQRMWATDATEYALLDIEVLHTLPEAANEVLTDA